MRTMQRWAGTFVLGAGIATGAATAGAAGLDCGVPGMARTPDPGLDRALRAAAHDPITDRDVRASIRSLAAAGQSKAEIVDRLVAAYCPLVAADSALSPAQKQDAVRDFAASIAATVYEPADRPDAVILSLPVLPTTADDIRVAAARAGQTQAEWLRTAVTTALKRG